LVRVKLSPKAFRSTQNAFKSCHGILKIFYLRWWLPGSCSFEAIANEAICYAAKIHLLYHVITVYAINNMAVTHTISANLVIRKKSLSFCEKY